MSFLSSSVMEIVIAAVLAVGLIFEPYLADAERRIFRRLKGGHRKIVRLDRAGNSRKSA